ncbi:non-ribosomal peptide synthetase [Aliterella atlantica]|uniref:Amino acid adenylation protein n=1 Tax=Aliterella atlantica CENA595 TaxID=1618023 RepID=A0A0D8ZUC4_9CYAN|nr:non-ribosomal peptide synthetase [Aliterella atlantica]KJH70841.1 amino acid adenylation protein [Aliterella atlantica CENA595]
MTSTGSAYTNISPEEVFVFPASFAQQRLWFLDRLFPNTAFYNVPTTLRLTGVLNFAALEKSFNAIASRHEILRTSFDTEDGQLVQVILPQIEVSLPLIDLQHLHISEREVAATEAIAHIIEQPFNLAEGSLLRVVLIQLSEQEYVLAIVLHHIVFDEWSSALLIKELGLLYTAFCTGTPSPLPELTIQYADFAHWQRERLQGELLATQISYWRSQLQDLPVLAISSDRKQTSQGATKFLELPQNLYQALLTLSQQEGVTLFMTLLAAFQTLLYRYTGQTDIAVGLPIANRNRRELEELIGFFANSLVLRTDLSDNPTFRELLARVKQVAVAAYTHQDLPFEKLVAELHPERNLSQNPLFQVVFALQNAPMEQLELPGLTLSPFKVDTTTARFDLEFYLWECGDNFRSLWGDSWQQSEGLRGVLVYNTDLFTSDAIARMLQHFQTLLFGIVANPDTSLADLPLLTSREQQQLGEWNQTKRSYPDLCIHQLFEQSANQNPNAIAVKFDERQLTYEQLNSGSNQLAHYLQKLGVGVETLVGICMEPSPVMVAAILAILKAGGAYVPLDPSYPPERLQFMVEDARVTVVITQDSLLHLFGGNLNIVCVERDWSAIASASVANPITQTTADNLAYVVYTSGSTGTPKGVAIPHKAVSRLVCNPNYINIEITDKVAQCANISFDAATFEIWGALLNGAQLVGINRKVILSPLEFTQEIQQQEISILFLTTALFNQIVREVPSAFSSLRYLLFGGEAVDVKLVQAVMEGAPQHLLHVYGPTENTTFTSWYEVESGAKSVPIGKAIANTQIYLLDANLNPVPVGVVGEIYIGGDGLAREYLHRPELTQERFIVNPRVETLHATSLQHCRLYKTGDLARYLPDGNLEFIGRSDNQVKIRGFRIELGEIETVLNQHNNVREVIVLVRTNVDDDRSIIAYIVPVNNLQPTELRDFLKAKLPSYALPAAIVILPALPLTPNGKVNRAALPAPDFAQSELSQTPRTSVEKQLVQIWQELLGKQAGINDNFFELGGHSLLATQLISRIRDRLGFQLPLRKVFETPTIAEIAEYIDLPTASSNREEVEF